MSTKDDINKLRRELEGLRTQVEKDFNDIGDEAVKLIKKRTRLGYSVSSHGSKKTKMKKLDPKYVKARKKNKPTGPSTPAKSNLTRSGDMLDDLTAISKSNNKIEIGFKNRKAEDKAEWVSTDRPFNNLSKAELKQLENLLQEKIDKAAKKSKS